MFNKNSTVNILITGLLLSYVVSAEDTTWETLILTDTGSALVNPGMGWVLHFYDNAPYNYGSKLEPSDTVDDFPGLAVVYLRIAWSFIEPEEGKFNWSVLDTPAQRWVSKGKKVALRITCSETPIPWATPKWVYDAGAKGYFFTPLEGIKEKGSHWEPIYDDSIFLEKLGNFLAQLAKRYDGNPEVAFIDIGSLGVWGEGHTWHSTQQKITVDMVKKHIDLHLKYFKNSLLVLNDDIITNGQKIKELSSEQREVLNYAVEKGLTLRDDSILVQGGENAYMSAILADEFWKNKPVVLESEHYGNSKMNNNWGDGSKYLQAVEDYHASYVSIHWWPREFLEERRDLIERINLRLGYRIVVKEVSWQKLANLSEGIWEAKVSLANVGVAPVYQGGYLAFTWKDSKDGIVGVFVDTDFSVKDLVVSSPGDVKNVERNLSFRLPFLLKPGRYALYLSVGSITGSPQIELPHPGNDGAKRYFLGYVEVI
ncbi:MAG: DUF4832 domain-containing protein [Candidatus Hydrogenedentes bacterium]|nr:DUF4832 domain-containing protein [Candidatus Hydrogenedentota bacterium]